MSDQPSLLDWTPSTKARRRGPETSKAAARKAQAWCTPQCDAILRVLCADGNGLIRAEIGHRTGIKESSCCARLKSMSDGGIIEVRGVRMGPYGTEQQVYHITPKGEARAKVLRDMACKNMTPRP